MTHPKKATASAMREVFTYLVKLVEEHRVADNQCGEALLLPAADAGTTYEQARRRRADAAEAIATIVAGDLVALGFLAARPRCATCASPALVGRTRCWSCEDEAQRAHAAATAAALDGMPEPTAADLAAIEQELVADGILVTSAEASC